MRMVTTTMTPEAAGRDRGSPQASVRRRTVRTIKVYWPVETATLVACAEGDLDALRSDESFATLLRVLETSPELGDFGVYGDVFEVAFGVEGFTVRPGARPSLGSVGDRFLSSTLSVTTYVDAETDDEELARVLARLANAHPWEIPVIELSAPLDLVTRALRRGCGGPSAPGPRSPAPPRRERCKGGPAPPRVPRQPCLRGRPWAPTGPWRGTGHRPHRRRAPRPPRPGSPLPPPPPRRP
ncbi:hypothetical protein, partial [Streptomyces sp. S3(2020)]|uniref:hypothetical protein n=1 Tax=Streptomyces sp. S3(2020) TaxID=2732044 RepID=UPI001F0F3B57